MTGSAGRLAGSFASPPTEAAHAFRAIMAAMARPGSVGEVRGAVPPAPMSVAAGTVLLTLCDPDTAVYLAGETDSQAIRDWVQFHTGAPLVGPQHADFAFGLWDDLMPLHAYRVGTSAYPDQSATLVVELPSLEATGVVLRGPGIKDTARLPLPDLELLQRNASQYPLGVDLMLVCGNRIAALPRSTQISEA